MKKLILTLGIFILSCAPAFARTCTWDGGGVDNLASTPANWDTDTTCVAGDAVLLNATSKACTLDLTAAFASITTTAGYGAAVTPSVTTNVTGNVTLADGTWTHGSQTLVVSSTSTITVGNNQLYGLTLSGYVAYAFGGDITTNGTFTYSNYASVTGGYTIHAKGDIVGSNSGSICDITATTSLNISIEGSTNQNVNFSTDSGYPLRAPVNIASTGGTVYFTNNTHRLSKGLTRSSGTVDFITNTSTVIFSPQSAAVNVMAGTYYALTFATYNSSTSYNTNLDGNITVNNAYAHGLSTTSVSGYVKLVGYRIYTKGSVTLNDYAAPGNTTVLDINGSGAQAVDLRGSTSYYNNIPIEVTNTSSVTFSNNDSYTDSTITFNGPGTYNLGSGVWYHKTGQITYTAGTLNASTSTLNIKGSFIAATNGLNWYNVTWSATNTTTLSSLLTVTNSLTSSAATTLAGTGGILAKDLTIDSTKSLSAAGNTLNVTGNFTNNGTFTASTSTVVFSGSTTQAVDGSTAFKNLTIISGHTVTFDDADTFSFSGIFTANGTATSQVTITSDSAGNQTNLDASSGATLDVDNVTATDVANAGAVTIFGTNLTLSNTSGWSEVTVPSPILVSALHGGLTV